MNLRPWGLAVALLSFGISAQGQQPVCAPISVNSAGTISAPTGAESATQLRVARLVNGQPETVSGLEFALDGGKWSLSPEKFAQLSELRSSPRRAEIKVFWLKDGGLVEVKPFLLPGEDRQRICETPSVQPPAAPAAPPAPPAPGGGAVVVIPPVTLRDCQPHLADLDKKIRARLGSDHYAIIIFKPDGSECVKSRPRGTAGDLIYTAVLVDRSVVPPGPSLEFTKCEAPSVSPNNPEADTLAGKTQSGGGLELFEFPPQQCFGTSAEMRIKNRLIAGDASTPKEISTTYALSLYNRFRFTLQTGILGTPQHSPNFGLRKDGNDMRVFNKGPVDEGPEYVATVVLYALPRYFGAGRPKDGDPLSGERDAIKSYFGRDIINDNGIADRLGFVLGADLNKPGDRVVAGLSFELGFGVNLIGVYEYAKVKELVGVSEGDIFTGTVEQIPTRDAWSGKLVAGVSMDLRYFSRLIRRAAS